ncbi:MAG: superoxide dismutase [Ni], partial [Ilumatobacteraceae bacterium]
MLSRLFSSATVAHAHCDLYCGVYDPAQAKIEALSVVKTAQKYHESDDEAFRQRCVLVKEQRAEEAARPEPGSDVFQGPGGQQDGVLAVKARGEGQGGQC